MWITYALYSTRTHPLHLDLVTFFFESPPPHFLFFYQLIGKNEINGDYM